MWKLIRGKTSELLKRFVMRKHTFGELGRRRRRVGIRRWGAWKSGLFERFTDGGDDRSSEEEGAALVPVAGVVGHVSDRAHSRAHGIHGVLQRSRAHIIVTTLHQRRDSRSRSRASSARRQTRQTHVCCRLQESEHISPPPANVYVRSPAVCLLRVSVRDPCHRLCNTPGVTGGDTASATVSGSTWRVTLPDNRGDRTELVLDIVSWRRYGERGRGNVRGARLNSIWVCMMTSKYVTGETKGSL